MSSVQDLRDRFLLFKGRYESELARHSDLQKTIDSLDEGIRIKNNAQATLSHLIDQMITKDMEDMDRLVNFGLRTVFPDRDIKFKSYIKDTGKTISIELKTLDKGREIHSDDRGSVSVVESFVLRMLCVMKLKKPKLILLDETFSAVGDQYINNVGILISHMAKKLGIDVLLVTHNPGASDARALRATLENDELKLTEVAGA